MSNSGDDYKSKSAYLQSSKLQKREIGPVLPPCEIVKNSELNDYGPALPPHQEKTGNNGSKSVVEAFKEDSSSEEEYGPALPPKISTIKPKRVLGPTLPSEADIGGEQRESLIGPQLPGSKIEDERLEARLRLGLPSDSKEDDTPKRECWMTELPSEKQHLFGLGPRQFKQKTVQKEDRSVWTKMPGQEEGDKEEKEETAVERYERERDTEMATYCEDFNKQKRSQSLLEMHQKDVKKQKSEKPAERQPFNRETDLGGANLSSAQKKNIIDKSRELGGRFSHGKKQFL